MVAGMLCGPAAGQQLSDPTRPPTPLEIAAWRGQPAAEPVRWRLQSVLISDRRRVALINGRRVSIGDTIDGARVAAIEPTHAIVKSANETRRLAIQRHGVDAREPQ